MTIEQESTEMTEAMLVTEDGAIVDWSATCRGEELGDDDEFMARDAATGEYYWVCVFCHGVVRPARRRAFFTWSRVAAAFGVATAPAGETGPGRERARTGVSRLNLASKGA